jgi:hypothetical protein
VHLSLVFHVFLVRLAEGTFLALLPLWTLRAAERHVRFQLVFAVCLLVGAAALHGAAAEQAGPAAAAQAGRYLSPAPDAPGPLLAAAVLALAANAVYGTFRRRAARAVLALACAVGAWAVLGTARWGPLGAGAGAGALAVLTLSGLLGGLVMGSIHNAMVLGHFYLLIRGLPLDALRRAGRTVAVALLGKIALLGGVLLLWGGASDVLLGREVLWTTWRTMFGFVGPLVLLWMVKDTVRLKHTQAATGLLYVAVGFALMGELAAVYLETATGLPV